MIIFLPSRQQLLFMLDRLTWHHARASLAGHALSTTAVAIYEQAAHHLLQGQERKFASIYAV